MKDMVTETEVDYSGADNFGSTLSIGKLVAGNVIPVDAVFDFDYISLKGRVYNDRNIPSPNGFQQLSYQEISGNYELNVGLIAKQKGIYALGIGDGLSLGRKHRRG